MSVSIHHLSNTELGKRLRLARESAGLTQAEAANAVDLSRTTLVAVEKGDRPVRDAELFSLIDVYGVTMNEILRREAVHVDLVPRFRKLVSEVETGIDEAISVLNDLVTAEVELETILGVERPSNLPPERPLLPGDVRKQAEVDALELRQRLGLGQGPIRNVFSLLELELGMRIYAHPLKNTVSGLFAYDDEVGACILINSNHRYERQVATGTHELGHTISARRRPDVCHDSFQYNSREERYATAFAPAFMMPARTVMQKLSEIRAGSKRLTRRHVIILADYFGVSREMLVRRLENLDLVPDGTWDWFVRNGGITDVQAEEVLGERVAGGFALTDRPAPTSIRLETLAAQALERDLLSEGQIAELLKIDRFKARRLRMEGEDSQNGVDQLSI
ncbi:MAG: XRE family transcriptional regulator [Pseudomonadota bacterium]